MFTKRKSIKQVEEGNLKHKKVSPEIRKQIQGRRCELKWTQKELAQKCNPIQLVANVLNNAAWLITNGASDIEEIEKAAKLGLGLRKPLFETAKEIGLQNIVDELNNLAQEHGEFYKPDRLLETMI